MTITSGGSPEADQVLDPRLASWRWNVFAVLHPAPAEATLPPDVFAERLAARGWAVRHCVRDEVEVTRSWCQVIIGRPGGAPKLAGVVAPERVDDLAAELAAVGLGFDLELDDERGSTARTVSRPADG